MGLDADDVLIVNSTVPIPVITKECPTATGDLFTKGDNPSYFRDPSLSGESWESLFV